MSAVQQASENEDLDWLGYSQNFHSGEANFQSAIVELTETWKKNGPPALQQIESIWFRYSPGRSTRFLVELIKADQAARVKRGIQTGLDDYLRHFSVLDDGSYAVSLAYAEFCNRQEAGQNPSINAFCEKYRDWGNSIRQQLELHQLLSIPSNELARSEAAARHFPRSGETIDHFDLVSELGRGGSARVFLARDTSLAGRYVALKISADRSTEPEILARLEHPHIVPVLSVHDAEDGLRLICMPYRGELTLDDLLAHHVGDKSNPRRSASDLIQLIRDHPKTAGSVATLPERDDGLDGFPHRGSFERAVAWIGWKLADALAHAHAQGIFHRDIKPANVLFSLRSGPQLLDFNMARDPNALAQVEDRIRGGTLPYMAPEQLAAFHDTTLWQEIGVRSDIYSLGLVLRELVQGERSGMPLSPKAPVAEQVSTLLRERSKPWKSLTSTGRGISHGFDAIIDKCLAFAPAHRYSSADALAEDFRRLLNQKPLKTAENKSLRERMLIRLRPLRLTLIPAAILLAFYFLMPTQSTPLINIPGLTNSAVEKLSKGKYAEALAEMNADPMADEIAPSARLFLEMVASAEVDPGNARVEKLIRILLQKNDFNDAIARANSVITSSRQLDFIPVFRDFCLLNNRSVEVPGSVGQIEWQNIESRLLNLQQKWPNDVSVASLLSHMASMRQDYFAALNQVERGLKLAREQNFDQTHQIFNEFRKQQIRYSQLLGAELQRLNQRQESLKYYQDAIRLIHEFRADNATTANQPEIAEVLAQFEVSSMIGIGDVQTDLDQFKSALEKYGAAEKLLDQYDSKITQSGFVDSLRLSIDQRKQTVIQRQEGLISQQKDNPAVLKK
jgi:serine/threonine protein kinase